ncbi:MAG: GYD domain-containing protein [Acidimicrobiia bacterium]
MPRYLMHGVYTAEAVKGLMAAGAASRLEAVRAMADGLGGSVESLEWGFGGKDSYAVLNLPDDAAAHAVALMASAAGEVTAIRLLSAEEVDESIRRGAAFRPPGN